MLNARRQHGVVVLGDLIGWRRRAKNRIKRVSMVTVTILYYTHTHTHTLTPPSFRKPPPTRPSYWYIPFSSLLLPLLFLILLLLPFSILRLPRKKREEEIVTTGRGQKKRRKKKHTLNDWKPGKMFGAFVICSRFVKYPPIKLIRRNGHRFVQKNLNSFEES